MAFDYSVDPDHRIVNVRAWGTLELDDHTQYTRRILNDPEVPTGYVEVVSFEEIEDFALQYSDYPIFRKEFEQLKQQKNQIGTVLVIASEFHYGMGRVIEMMAGDSAQFDFTADPDEGRRIALRMLEHAETTKNSNGAA